MTKKIIFNKHHPWRERWPDFTIPLRKGQHMFMRRLEQYKPTLENLGELSNVLLAIRFVYHKMATILKKDSNDKLEQMRKKHEKDNKNKKKIKGA